MCVMYAIVYALFCNNGIACSRLLSIDERILLNQMLIQRVNLPLFVAYCLMECRTFLRGTFSPSDIFPRTLPRLDNFPPHL